MKLLHFSFLNAHHSGVFTVSKNQRNYKKDAQRTDSQTLKAVIDGPALKKGVKEKKKKSYHSCQRVQLETCCLAQQ